MMVCLGARNGPFIVRRLRLAGHEARMRGSGEPYAGVLVWETEVNFVGVDRWIILKFY